MSYIFILINLRMNIVTLPYGCTMALDDLYRGMNNNYVIPLLYIIPYIYIYITSILCILFYLCYMY